MSRAPALLVLLLAVTACAAPAPEPPRLEPVPRLPDVPDAFRAELLGGRAPDCRLRGQAVYLGGGRFLTAAHLVDDIVPRLRGCTGIPLEPLVVFRGHTLPVRLVRLGDGKLEPDIGPVYRKGEDLALLQATGALPDLGGGVARGVGADAGSGLGPGFGAGARPCPEGPARGQAVIVLSGQRHEAEAGGMVPERRAADGGYADLPLHLAQGESGAGVFDARSFCLLGVVSHRPDDSPSHSRIVPAATILSFLGGVQAAPVGEGRAGEVPASGAGAGGAGVGAGGLAGAAGDRPVRGAADTAGRIGAPGA